MTTSEQLEQMSMLTAPESCLELARSGINISLDVWLDPDGPNWGFAPIQAYCTLPQGKTSIALAKM